MFDNPSRVICSCDHCATTIHANIMHKITQMQWFKVHAEVKSVKVKQLTCQVFSGCHSRSRRSSRSRNNLQDQARRASGPGAAAGAASSASSSRLQSYEASYMSVGVFRRECSVVAPSRQIDEIIESTRLQSRQINRLEDLMEWHLQAEMAMAAGLDPPGL
jgi:hypothetical protein